MEWRGMHRRSTARDGAEMLYVSVVGHARTPAFYARLGVPDSVDGRFELIALHAWLLMRRLGAEGTAQTTAGAQALFDVMFEDMDRSLREMGAGDLGVGRRVKAMAKSFYGRVDAYDTGLAEGDDALRSALRRNLYGTVDPTDSHVRAMAAYLRREDAALVTQTAADIVSGVVAFGAPPDGG